MPPLFKRSSTSGQHFLFFVVLSLSLMFLDYRNSSITTQLRDWLSIPTEPIRFLVREPFDIVDEVKENFASQKNLLAENKRLQKEQALLKIQLAKWKSIKQENLKLRALLNTLPEIDGRVSGAQIISMNNPLDNQILLLNEGRSAGVFIGQPVLDTQGFIGQIIRVDRFKSVVLLVTDLKSAVPVEVVRTGERGILAGTGSMNTLILNNLPKTSHVKKGDLLITSSLGGRFPAGYPVGHIRKVLKKPSDMFSQIIVSPTAKIQQNRVVFLLWPNEKPSSHIASPPKITS